MPHYYRLLTVILIFFLPAMYLKTTAQSNADADYSPLPANSYTYAGLHRYKIYLDSVSKINTENLDKKLRKDYKEIITEKNTDLIKELSENDFLFDNKIDPYLSSIFFTIVHKNELDNYPFHFFISRSSLVNAYTFEDGTIVCNLGLLNVMENESEIAMVFCHELAHYLLKHSAKSITAQLEKYNSPEFEAHIKTIKKEEYHVRGKLEGLLMEDVFNRRKHNRAQETAADSLGMLLFLKTGYNTSSVPRLYDLLNESENMNTPTTIKYFLEKEGIVADEKWFDTGKRIAFGKPVTKEMADSLKTHPDCLKRKKYAEFFLSTHSADGYDFKINDKETLAAIKKNALFEQSRYPKDKKDMSLYFYHLVEMDVQFPHNKYISTEIFNALLLFTIAQKNHALYTITDKPYYTDDDKDEYAKLLALLEKIDLVQLAEAAKTYYQNNKQLITLNAETTANFDKIKQL